MNCSDSLSGPALPQVVTTATTAPGITTRKGGGGRDLGLGSKGLGAGRAQPAGSNLDLTLLNTSKEEGKKLQQATQEEQKPGKSPNLLPNCPVYLS